MDTVISVQPMLMDALREKDEDLFKKGLENNEDPFEVDDDDNYISVFELACQTPGCSKFIKLCLERGEVYDINQLNPNVEKAPINFAAESIDVDNLSAVLDAKPNINSTYDGLTAIHQLISYIDGEHDVKNIFKCIRLLIDHKIDVNIPDSFNNPPILTLLKIKVIGVQPIIEYLLEKCDIDLDSFGNGEVRKLLAQKFPHKQFSTSMGKTEINFFTLKQLLDNHRESEFIRDLDCIMQKKSQTGNVLKEDSDNGTLFYIACKEGIYEVVKHIIQKYNVDINFKPAKLCFKPISITCYEGQVEVLKCLLQQNEIILQNYEMPSDKNDNSCVTNEITEEPLLCLVIEQMKRNPKRYLECFDILINDQRIDINETNSSKKTALYSAVKYRRDTVILELLKRGAYIGTTTRFGDFAISEIKPSVLENFFNSCITPNDLHPGDENYEIFLDYNCLVPVKDESEMAPIEFMAKSPELRHLISHPLIAGFLWLKWSRLEPIFYFNLILFTIFCLSLITFVVLRHYLFGIFFFVVTVIGLLYVLIREVTLMIIARQSYFKSINNYLKLCLILTTTYVIFDTNYANGDYFSRIIGAVTILLAATELSMLFGSLPFMSISVHMVMLKTVFLTFMKSFLLYSILIISFGLSFFILFGPVTNADEDNDFNNFPNPILSIIKTIVMFTGEFETADLPFNNQLVSYLIFMLFIFVVSIVLLNLLNGLAIIDTQCVKSESQLTELIYRTHLLSNYEQTIINQLHHFNCGPKTSSFLVFQNILSIRKLILMPNFRNSVFIYVESYTPVEQRKPQNFTLQAGSDEPEKFRLPSPITLNFWPFSNSSYRLDILIVKRMKNVVNTKIQEDELEKAMKIQEIEMELAKKKLEERYAKIESSLRRNEECMEAIYEKLKKLS